MIELDRSVEHHGAKIKIVGVGGGGGNAVNSMIERGLSPVVEEQQLSETDVRAEALFLGMRLMRGIDLRRYRESFGVDLREAHAADLDRFHKAGLLEFDGDLIKLTRSGALLSNEVFAAFV